jgi:NADH-quinone oxidoreductase subunit M
LIIGVMYERLHTREMKNLGGLAAMMPAYAFALVVLMLAAVALPGTNGFVGEFLSLAGAYKVSTWATLIATTGIILGAGYMLYLYRRIAFGPQVNADAAAISDVNGREMWLLAPIAVVVLWMGVYPETFLAPIRRDVATIVARVERAAPAGDSKLK